jgi:hypothetical protein
MNTRMATVIKELASAERKNALSATRSPIFFIGPE